MKKKLLFFLFITTAVSAQNGYQEHIVIDKSFGSQNPQAVATADINGDGFLDIVTVAGDEIVWYKNLNGSGDFSKPITISDASGGRIDVFDVNKDGFLDVVFTGKWSAKGDGVYWIKNTDGQGTFSSPVLIYAANNISDTGLSAYQIIDIDNDNDLDILIMTANNYSSSWLNCLKNDGSGNFKISTLITDFLSFSAIDINGDKLPDLVIRYTNHLKTFIQQTDGSFTSLATITPFSMEKKFLGEDIDNDGDQDIVFVYDNGGSVDIKWYENKDGKGTFSGAKFLVNVPEFSGIYNAEFYRILLTDFDADGKKDILFYYTKANKVSWFKNNGAGTFGAEQIIKSISSRLYSFAAGDMNNDGSKDVVAILNDDVVFFKNTEGKGVFEEIKVSKYAYGIHKIVSGDLDGDGDIDIVSTSYNKKITWYKNTNGLGDFSGEQFIISDEINIPGDLFVMDIDNDGDLDVVATSLVYGSPDVVSIFWSENDGAGNFSKQRLIASGSDAKYILFTDVNKDGNIDVIATLSRDKVYLIKNLGKGAFAEKIALPYNSTSDINNCFIEDFNQDGNIDYAVVDYGKIFWYENDGSGNFTTEHVKDITKEKVYILYMADLDNDKDLDFVYRDSNRNVGWFENLDGKGNYAVGKILFTSAKAISTLSLYDADSDGDIDIVYNMITETATTWHENLGAGKMSPAKVLSSTTMNLTPDTFADFNADGRLDKFAADIKEDKIAWYENLGPFKNTIRGTIRLDIDNNSCDSNDPKAPLLLVSTSNGTNTFSTFTKQDGTYDFIADVNTYTTSVVSSLKEYPATPSKYVSTFTAKNQNEVVDFCLEPSSLFEDLEIRMYPYGEPRPGFTSKYKIHVTNNGTKVKSGLLSLKFDDSKLEFISSGNQIDSKTANTIQFAYKDLKAFETKTIDVTFKVFTIPTTTLGDKLSFNLAVPVPADTKPIDNEYVLKQIVVGSYDPNDIRVLEGEEVLIDNADEYLHYIIRFQNKGNSYAQRVRVSNLLDDKLDWTTLKIESYSHNNTVTIIDGKEADFTFDAIYLPSAITNEEASNGYIAYKIKPKSNVSLGDIFNNDAAIFFDYNPDIKTNTVSTKIVDKQLGTDDFVIESIIAYPNPTKGLFTVQSRENTIQKMVVHNTLGQVVLNSKQSNSVDLSSLVNGIYFITITDNNNKSTTIKVVKN